MREYAMSLEPLLRASEGSFPCIGNELHGRLPRWDVAYGKDSVAKSGTRRGILLPLSMLATYEGFEILQLCVCTSQRPWTGTEYVPE